MKAASNRLSSPPVRDDVVCNDFWAGGSNDPGMKRNLPIGKEKNRRRRDYQ